MQVLRKGPGTKHILNKCELMKKYQEECPAGLARDVYVLRGWAEGLD